jgi:hypothetical protein
MPLLILFAFIAFMFILAGIFGKTELYKVSGVIPAENRRVTFYESESYDDAMIIASFGWKGRGLDDITVEWGESELPIDKHGNRSVANPYWTKEN